MIYEYTKFYLQDLNLDLLKIDGAEIAYFWTGKKMENQSEREREREPLGMNFQHGRLLLHMKRETILLGPQNLMLQ